MDYVAWKKWWTDIAPKYFTDKIWQFSKPDLIAKLDIQPTTKILEIGFGYGREISQFCKLSNYVYGVELTKWACENTAKELRERGIKTAPILLEYDGHNLPFENQSIDIIYSCFVLQHLSRQHTKDLIKETLRILSPNGKILFEFFGDPAYYNNGEDVFSGIDGEGGMFNNAFIAAEIDGIVQESGGKLVWLHTSLITKEWGNHWACISK